METNSAIVIEGPMDPTDEVDYVGEFFDLLLPGETIVSGFTVVPSARATEFGFKIGTTTPPALEAGSLNVVFWCEVDIAKQQDNVFDNDGAKLEVLITVETTGNRTYQRTFEITVKQL